METSTEGRAAAAAKMRAAGAHEEAIRAFESAYARLVSGQEAMLPTAELEPAGDVPALDELEDADSAVALEHLAVIKLNGGLATSMGLQEPKSLVEAREGRSFLDIIVGQTLALRERYGVRLPLVLMNSDATREPRPSGPWPAIRRSPMRGSTPDFLQSMIPKLDAETLAPVELAASAGARVVPARARRRVRRTPPLGDARGAARAGVPLRHDLELRQPRSRARRADRRPPGPRADPVPDGGGPGHRGRPQGRPHRAPALRRPARAARDRADTARGRGVLPRLPVLALLQHQQPVGRSAGPGRDAGAARMGCSSCR